VLELIRPAFRNLGDWTKDADTLLAARVAVGRALATAQQSSLLRKMASDDDDDDDDTVNANRTSALASRAKRPSPPIKTNDVMSVTDNDGEDAAITVKSLAAASRKKHGGLVRPMLSTQHQNQIEHLVVLLMENRGFDHLFGCLDLPGADSAATPTRNRSLWIDPTDKSKGVVNVTCGTAKYVCPAGPSASVWSPKFFHEGAAAAAATALSSPCRPDPARGTTCTACSNADPNSACHHDTKCKERWHACCWDGHCACTPEACPPPGPSPPPPPLPPDPPAPPPAVNANK
jgi:hypothetical protein